MIENLRTIAGVLYLALATFAVCVFARERRRIDLRRSALVWLMLAALLGLLAVQAFTDASQYVLYDLRVTARSEGWYMARRPMQKQVIIGLAITVVLTYLALVWKLRRKFAHYLWPLTATAFLLGFHGIGAISLHQVDALLNKPVGPANIKSAGQSVGVALVTLALLTGLRRRQESAPTGPEQAPEPAPDDAAGGPDPEPAA